MASNPVSGMGGFFPGMLEDLLKLLQTDSPFPFELAEQLAQSVAAEGSESANPDPVERIRLEDLLSIAELHVADVTGMSTSASGSPLRVVAVSRAEWARRLLSSDRAIFERLAQALNPPPLPAVETDAADESGEGAHTAAFFAKWSGAIAPAMVAMQFGSLVGHLARRTLGQYSLPIPSDAGGDLAIITENLSAYSKDWSIPLDDLRLAVLVRDVTTHTILSRPHVRARLTDLLVRHADGLQPSPGALEARLDQASGADLGALMGILGDPSALGELLDTPEFREVRAELGALGATISGYVEWVSDAVGARAIGANSVIREALRRSRAAISDEDRGSDVLFSDLTNQSAIDRGESFVKGVLDQGGETDLAKLWVGEENIPTPTELDDPAAWIERINLETLFDADETPE